MKQVHSLQNLRTAGKFTTSIVDSALKISIHPPLMKHRNLTPAPFSNRHTQNLTSKIQQIEFIKS